MLPNLDPYPKNFIQFKSTLIQQSSKNFLDLPQGFTPDYFDCDGSLGSIENGHCPRTYFLTTIPPWKDCSVTF